MEMFERKVPQCDTIHSPEMISFIWIAILAPFLVNGVSSLRCEILTNFSPVVCIPNAGCIRGKSTPGMGNDPYDAFQGIPFAKPPLDKLRFSDPVPNDPWVGEYDATWERSACLQKTDLRVAAVVMGSEDCLYLNVFRPRINTTNGEKLAVMVYIHGGGFFSGSASTGVLGPEKFMKTKRVILVTIQYRLGVYGFLSTGDHAARGNFGMKDQVLALKWVNKNIDAFGGDSNLITIFGHSAGGASVQLHMLSPLSRRLFSRAIVMSGSALAIWSTPLQNPLEQAQAQAKAAGIPASEELSTEELVDKLRQIDPVNLASSIDKLKTWHRAPLVVYRPTIDGEFLPEAPRTMWKEGKYHHIPWLIGYAPNEGSVASLAIITNETLLNDFSRNIRSLLPSFLGERRNTPDALELIKGRYFPGNSEGSWLNCENLNNLSDIIGDAWIKYPIIDNIKQHVKLSNESNWNVYYFNFKGRYSYSYIYTNNLANFGTVHEDELLYLFRSPALFPDFPVGSPEYHASEAWVNHYVSFAHTGHTENCDEQKCRILELTNSDGASGEVVFNVIQHLDDNMYNFWNQHYNK
ncbi:juvenile hormone esterase-like [Toxorhynchites rutilus septentrionalis]|uniref:juvenile hormone esterase-like n=1 Tax=Toxorhynchites rutilus septentrionalis TaxID=329112 RepID=UPI0024785B69|nr:juvenile hormone esterase-like [Toxorhynchites rutilus septentrionalis]